MTVLVHCIELLYQEDRQARIAMARAIYSPADIILLDDVLAALDVHTYV